MTQPVDDERGEVQFKEAGRRARKEFLEISRLAETMRLASFRAYLSGAVQLMPTLLPDVSASVGVTFAEVVERLRPSAAWPACAGRHVAPARPVRLPSFTTLGRRWSATPHCDGLYPHPSRTGSALISEGAPAACIEIVASGRWLEIVARGDAFWLTTHEGTARLKIEGRLPEVVLSTCVGRRLDDLVDLGILRDRGLIVETGSVLGCHTVLQFRTGGSPITFPPWD